MLPNQSRPQTDMIDQYRCSVVDVPAAGAGRSVSGDEVSYLDVARKN